jgi:hypothetical protein
MHSQLIKLVRLEKRITARILERLQLVSDQKLFLTYGYSSLFDYMVRGLGYSETTASFRLSCLRLIREIPEVAEKIEQGKLSYTAVARAHKVLRGRSSVEKRKVLKQIEGMTSRDTLFELSKYEEEKVITVKKRIVNEKVRITIEFNREEYEKWEKLKALHSNKIHSDEDLLRYLLHKELKLPSDYSKHRSKSVRYIPMQLKNLVLKKANFKCQQIHCNQTHYLQIDHIKPISKGGKTEIMNLQVLCREHNQMKSDYI